ncbi:hypothetical protein VCRA2116O372_320008 [Vibrio crassostreae]|nr:hypothetical protein VCRA2116O372_320008 [Vibrio crassostreae]CAK2494192.1 hypothetical protein VCRA2116O374_320008 [Vibrio crassostreae]CAK2498487.1 hypothetical protein VCRA2116O373_340033 [Vibrio crassostreae]CAK2846201.1 hypothetical protein VCRA2134O405_290008 [Vibrio crassostreae]CAK3406726.1 hypothetical protein VCRA2123O395_370018 [Vibrio crassostreae]
MTKKEDWLLKQGISMFQSQSPYQQESHHDSYYQLNFDLTSVEPYFFNPIRRPIIFINVI